MLEHHGVNVSKLPAATMYIAWGLHMHCLHVFILEQCTLFTASVAIHCKSVCIHSPYLNMPLTSICIFMQV